MDDIQLALMTGVDIPIPQYQVVMHQPTLKEISMMGELNFFLAAQCLCIDIIMLEQIGGADKKVFQGLNNFQLLTQIFEQDSEKKNVIANLLTLLFPTEKVMITPRSIILKDEAGLHIIDEKDFESFQEILRKVLCLQLGAGDNFNPANDKAAEIAKKLSRARQRVAAQKAASGESGTSLAQYISVLTVGLGSMSLQDCIELTMFQLYDLMERYGLYIAWDLDVKTRLAGGDPKSQPDNWMKSLH